MLARKKENFDSEKETQHQFFFLIVINKTEMESTITVDIICTKNTPHLIMLKIMHNSKTANHQKSQV
jgi:hypothetical protein